MKQFGGKITKELEAVYTTSPNWKEDKFVNLVETTMDVNMKNMPGLLYKSFFEKEGRVPKNEIPLQPFQMNHFMAATDQSKMIWYGHSVVLMRMNNVTLLIDPMLGPDASPIAPFTTKRFSSDTLSVINELPPIDLVLITHDHYDHLDYASIQRLKGKVSRFYVALGVKRHLVSWGVDADCITEFDWWDEKVFEGISITFTPSRHFSGRGLKDRMKSMWGGWVFNNGRENIYFSGDSGYGTHFKGIGDKLGPFDFGFMECGQYYENWRQIHMFPDEAVQASLDAGVKKALPVHWGGFSLSLHQWKDPIAGFMEEANRKELLVAHPEIGALFHAGEENWREWWEELD